MDYKSKLQTNNTTFRENNTDLQAILNTINSLPNAGSTEAINLDAEITEQEGLIDQIQAALEGKAVSGDSSTKTTKTIYLDWTEDREGVGEISYISNGEVVGIYKHNNIESIEAENGIVLLDFDNQMCSWTSNFIVFYIESKHQVLIAKQDGETIYLVSSEEAEV